MDPGAETPAVSATGVRYAYPGGGEPALRDVSFEVNRGRTVALMGGNGAGKTTLLRLLAGLREPDVGVIDVAPGSGGEAVVGFGTEDPRSGFFAATVAEEVAFFPRNRGLDVDRRTDAALDAVGASSLRDRSPLSLSAGEGRRVSIASVLAGDPDLVVLDEPTHGLHRSGADAVGALLGGLDRTVIYSTHDADLAHRHADAVIVLHGGRVAGAGDPETVLSDDALLDRAGIRPPGLVEWARDRGLSPVPGSIAEAADRLAAGADGG